MRKFISFVLVFLMCFGSIQMIIHVDPVIADITINDVFYNVENIVAQSNPHSYWSNQQIFWAEDEDRWYIIYPFDVSGTDQFLIKYSYSDSGDPTSWNNGGYTGGGMDQIRNTPISGMYVSAQVCWVYDNENDLGHYFYYADFSMGASVGCYYRNFTIDVGGSLSWGNKRELQDVMTGTTYGSVDIALSHSGLPIVAFGGFYSSDYHTWGSICDSIDGYNGAWTTIQYQPTMGHQSISVIPTGDQSCVLISSNASAANPLKMFEIDFTSTSNSSGTGTTFSDRNVQRDTGYSSHHAVSYNSTHGCVNYIDASDLYNYVFIFDFDTMTRSTEYLADDYDGGEIWTLRSPGVSVNGNEFFTTCQTARATSEAKDIRANEYHNPSYDDYFNSSAAEVIVDDFTTSSIIYGMCTSRMTDDDDRALVKSGNGVYVGVAYVIFEGEYPSFEVSADLEDVDDDGADWVFTDWKYYTFYVETALSEYDNISISFTVPTGEENIDCGFWSDGEDWAYASNMSYQSREGEPCILQAGSWNETSGIMTFKIWFESKVLDLWDPSDGMDVYGQIDAGDWFLAAANLFRIYSKGGFEMNFASTGAAGKLAGGTPFSLYGNSGSIVYNEIWYRDGQHIKLMPDIHFLTGLDPFYVRYGVDYSLGDGEWLQGWSIYINPKFVSYTGIFAANVWINMTNLWMNRGSYIDDENLYMFYHGSVSGVGDPGHWKSWVDLWFSDKNASRVGAGRYNAYEFPMIDNADLWLRWLANSWGVKDNVLKEMSTEIPLLDTDNSTVISSEQIKMMRFWCELEVDDADSGQYVSIENYEAFDITHSRDLPLVGMTAPVFDETLIPTIGQKGILGALFSMFTGLGQWLSENIVFGGLNLWSTFVDFLDTIAAMFGAPKFFTNLFDWIYEALGYVYLSFEYVLSIVSSVFSLMGVLLAAFLTTMADIITSFVNAISMFTDMMAGGYGVGVDVWETFGISQWITVAIIFYPLYLVILWDQEGMDAVVSQLSLIFGILSWLFGFFVTLIQFVIRLITTVIESIPVAE